MRTAGHAIVRQRPGSAKGFCFVTLEDETRPAPGADGLYFATGGAHIGMTLGPTFGRIIADLVAGRDPGVDLTPYRPNRW